MTAPSAPNALLNDEEGGTNLAGVVDLVVASLCPGMSRTDALMTLVSADNGRHPLAGAASTLLTEAKHKEMVNHFVGIILMLECGLPASTSIGIAPHQGVLLGQAAELCQAVADPYWRFIALSLRAECLLLLSQTEGDGKKAGQLREDAVRAAEASQGAYAPPMGTRSAIEDRRAYNRDVIEGKTPPVTTRLFLNNLHDELVPVPAATMQPDTAHDEEPLLVPA